MGSRAIDLESAETTIGDAAPDAVPGIAPRSYLVVDDDAAVRQVFVDILRRLGATKVETAANGIEALAHLDAAQAPPDVMLVDLVMPGMGGVEMLRCLAERAYAGSVLLVSGVDDETLRVAAGLARYRALNVLGCIAKPMSIHSLERALNTGQKAN